MNVDAPPLNDSVQDSTDQFSFAWKRSLNQLYDVVRVSISGVVVSKDTAGVFSVGLYGVTPVIRYTVAGASAVRIAGATAAFVTDTYDGYTLAQVVKALRNIGVLT